MSTIKTELVAGYPSTIRMMAAQFRELKITYHIERVEWKNFNTRWKGFRGIALRIASEDYKKLFHCIEYS